MILDISAIILYDSIELPSASNNKRLETTGFRAKRSVKLYAFKTV